jgi:hypothetical protein
MRISVDRIDQSDTSFAFMEPGNARRLVQVYNGGSIPSGAGYVYLTNPVELDGVEIEGGVSTANTLVTVSIPVVVLTHSASVGDLLVAIAVGGRWVAEKGAPSQESYTCGQCAIPMGTLMLSWTNSLIGNGSTPLNLVSPGLWESACTNRLQYQLRCTGGVVELRVMYFLSGTCPNGKSEYCSNLGTKPLNISVGTLNCQPLVIVWSVTVGNCPFVFGDGYTSFTITE